MKKIGIKILQAAIVFGLFIGACMMTGRLLNSDLRTVASQEFQDSLLVMRSVFPDNKFIASPETNTVIVKNKSGKKVAELLFTMPYCQNIKGFGGKIPMIIVIDAERKIEQLVLLSNNETPDWIGSLEDAGFMKSWNGLTPNEAAVKQVDAVSGATFSSNAILESVKLRCSVFCNEVHKSEETNKKSLLINIAVILTVVFALIQFIFPGKLRKVRWLMHLLNIVVMGFLTVNFLSVAFFYNSLLNGMDLIQKMGLFLVLILSVIIPLLSGKAFYCQYVCPFGSLQYFSGLLKKRKLKIPTKVSRLLSYTKYVYLFTLLVILVSGVSIVLEDFEPFTAFAYKFAAISAFIIAGVFAVLAVFLNKPWCRYFCPTGAVLELMRKPLIAKTKTEDEE
ncbi:MAG TPA: 4Fe-4S binding protein [Bacteroidales bacterium]|nr:4Fe-4S binding protein [Bacteroidales bacterium]